MPEKHIRITMPAREADAFLFTPGISTEATTPLSGIIDFPDIRGLRKTSREMSQRLANEGYLVLSPNTFYRFGPPPVFDDVPWDFTNPITLGRFRDLTSPLTPEAVAADAEAWVHTLDENGAAPGPIGVVGHCYTGTIALYTAAALPDRIAAAVSFHGGGLYKQDDPASPHLQLPKIKASLYFGHAKNDNSMPADAIRHLEEALADWGGLYESEVYNAPHGWTVPDNASYNRPEAERAHAKLVSLLPTLRPDAARP